MTKGRSWIGLLIGLAGCALLGWALFTALTSADCAASAAARAAAGASQGCASDPGPAIAFAIPGGIILGMIGIFAGGGFLIFSAMFLSVGLSALVPTILGLMPDMQVFGWVFGGAFLLGGLLPLFLAVSGGRRVAEKMALAEELMRSGAKGVGTIVEVRDTGVTLNDNPQVAIRMRVEPVGGGPAVERSKTVIVSRVAIPRAGDRFPVWYDRIDPDKWMYGTDMEESAPAEVKEMFARARAAGGDEPGDGGVGGGEADGPVAELARLTDLWKDGALTDREFADAKARLLPKIGRD